MRQLSRRTLALFTFIGAMSADGSDVASILRDRVNVRKETVGIGVAIVTPDAQTFHTFGALCNGGGSPVAPQTLFRIASATKAFTGMLLADMVNRGEVSLDDPVAKYLPSHVTVPQRNGKAITLRHLATHRSGLPRMPDNYRDDRHYGTEDLYRFLLHCHLESEPGTRYHYSNLGSALLGLALCNRAGKTFEELLVMRVTGPLSMTATGVRITEANERLARGHSAGLRPQPLHASVESLAGASEVVSSVHDLARLASAILSSTPSTIREAFLLSAQPIASRDEYHADIGLGWWSDRHRDRTFIWHGGESRDGYKSFIGFDLAQQRAVIVLSNSRNPIEDIGFHLLDERLSLDPWGDPPRRAEAAPNSAEYIGKYRVRPNYTITVQQRDGALYAHGVSRPRRLHYEGKDRFRIHGVSVTLTFVRRDNGEIESVIMAGGGQIGEGERLH